MTSSAETAVRRDARTLAIAFFPYSMGYFGALSVLAIVLQERYGSAFLIGLSLLAFTLGDGLGGLIFSRLLPRVDYRRSMAVSMSASAAAYLAFGVFREYLVCVVLLALAATGGSVFAILGRTMVAQLTPMPDHRHRIFSAVQVAFNIAAAAGPAAFGLLLSAGLARFAFAASAALYCASAMISVALVPARLRPPAVAGAWPISRISLRRIIRSRTAVQMLCLVLIGSVLYRQFYSAYALQMSGVLGPNERAALFWGNALLVAALQLPVSRAVRPLITSDVRITRVMAVGVAVFAVSLAFMGVLPVAFGSFLVVMVIFSVAETIYTPTVSTGIAGIPSASVLESFNIRQVTWTAGSGLGALLGGTVYIETAGSVGPAPYWLGMAALTSSGVLAVLLRHPRRAGERAGPGEPGQKA
jgi:MFS transporter, DHA1 family, multidrug resistance protein